jgi:hypothetical protein
MPVHDAETHERVQIKADKPYGCWGRKRLPVLVDLGPTHCLRPTEMSRDCRYDLHQKDPRCTGCPTVKDEAYLASYGLLRTG